MLKVIKTIVQATRTMAHSTSPTVTNTLSNYGSVMGGHTGKLLTMNQPNRENTRGIFTTPPNFNFQTDVMLGGAGGEIAKEAKKREASTDGRCFTTKDAGTRALQNYMDAYRKLTGKEISEEDAINSRPWVELHFANRNHVQEDPIEDPVNPEREATGFVRYAREAVDTALKRDGQVFFTMSGWNPLLYQQQALAAEIEHGMPYAEYLNHCTRPIPKITNMEIGDMNESGGGMEKVPVTYLSASGKVLDSDRFKALFQAASEACRSPANRDAMRASLEGHKARDDSIEEFIRVIEGRGSSIHKFQFDPLAVKAVKELQDFIA